MTTAVGLSRVSGRVGRFAVGFPGGLVMATFLPQAAGGRTGSRRRLTRGLRGAAVAVALWLLVSWAAAYRLTRRPHPMRAEPAPAAAWGAFESHRIKTRDGHELGAWLVRGKPGGASVLLLHGNGGSRWNCLGRAETLAAEGCTVLLVSLRAHGDSTGDYNDIGFGARHDVVAAVGFLERLRPGKPILIHGTSLGAAAATFASGELARRVHGYILESPYRDLKTAVWNRVEDALPPVLDRVAYGGLLVVAPLVFADLGKIAPVEAVAGIPDGVPVLILAGGRDRKARPEEARALFERMKSHATLSVFADADHLRFPTADPERYRREVAGFVRRVERGHGVGLTLTR